LIVNSLVQLWPRFLDRQSGALRPQEPEKAVMTISFGCRAFGAMLISPSLNVSVIFKSGSVLFTTVSTTKTSNCTAFPAWGLPAAFIGSKSSATTGREYEVVSGGELRTLSSAIEGVGKPPVAATARSAAQATVRASLHNASCFIVISSHNVCDPPPITGRAA
jgi:hypothetical protein